MNPNWQEANQLAICKSVRGVEPGSAVKQVEIAVRAGLEPWTGPPDLKSGALTTWVHMQV